MSLKTTFNRIPNYVWIIILLVANVVSCVLLLKTCDAASGRSVDDSLFRPEDDQEEEELVESNELKEKPVEVAPIDTVQVVTFDEMIDTGADILQSGDMTDPNNMEEQLDMMEYDGVDLDDSDVPEVEEPVEEEVEN